MRIPGPALVFLAVCLVAICGLSLALGTLLERERLKSRMHAYRVWCAP